MEDAAVGAAVGAADGSTDGAVDGAADDTVNRPHSMARGTEVGTTAPHPLTLSMLTSSHR